MCYGYTMKKKYEKQTEPVSYGQLVKDVGGVRDMGNVACEYAEACYDQIAAAVKVSLKMGGGGGGGGGAHPKKNQKNQANLPILVKRLVFFLVFLGFLVFFVFFWYFLGFFRFFGMAF